MSLTSQESEIVNALAMVWNQYLKLPVEHDLDASEFCAAIHACQEKVLARSGRREINQ